jgi:hypothetical protein
MSTAVLQHSISNGLLLAHLALTVLLDIGCHAMLIGIANIDQATQTLVPHTLAHSDCAHIQQLQLSHAPLYTRPAAGVCARAFIIACQLELDAWLPTTAQWPSGCGPVLQPGCLMSKCYCRATLATRRPANVTQGTKVAAARDQAVTRHAKPRPELKHLQTRVGAVHLARLVVHHHVNAIHLEVLCTSQPHDGCWTDFIWVVCSVRHWSAASGIWCCCINSRASELSGQVA